jgi:hypothetical protein
VELAMAHNIFVSHASKDLFMDSSWLNKALEQLRKRKVLSDDDNIFIDKDSISEGENFREATRAAIGAADTVVVFWSPAAADSKWVNYEMGMADALGKRLVIVAPRGTEPQPPLDSDAFELIES